MSSHGIAPGGSPLVWQAQTRRRVFLGKDEDTEFVRAIDGATLDYYAGDCAVSPVTVRKFDFTADESPKDYAEALPRQYHCCGKLGLDFIRISDMTVFSPEMGYGWKSVEGLEFAKRNRPDCLRRDWVGSARPATLMVELARGSYRMLVVTGDAEDSTFTSVGLEDGTSWSSGIIKPGRFVTRMIPFHLERDGVARIALSSDGRRPWTLCAMIINRG